MLNDRPRGPFLRRTGVKALGLLETEVIERGGYRPPPSSEGPKNPPIQYTNPIKPPPKPDTPEKP
ncbi:hypothetical protein [Roseospira goensis]|uniref:Uncharacterized protein n=1 Tax=Roseospira goensis TaxID=391922 RepID=A0A7W6RYV7_9PROT|nr:hypothetical protein [Roseospira goensis]MBB4285667.1 hypothetical protein [Roseospira goensis]